MTNYGRDISCTTSIRSGRFVTGARLVAEAAYRRLTTPRGMLRGGEEEADYGIDLADMVGSATTKADKASLSGRIATELKKDERITDVLVTVDDVSTGPGTEWIIGVEAKTGAGPFSLQVAVKDLDISLIGINAEG